MQKIIWGSIKGKQDVIMLTSNESGAVNESTMATATEHVGEVETAAVVTLPNGTATTAILDPADITADSTDRTVGILSYVMIVSNLPRSWLELRLLLKSIPHPVEAVMSAWEDVAPPPPTDIQISAPIARRSLLQQDMPGSPTEAGSAVAQPTSMHETQTRNLQQLESDALAPVFGIISASAVALATCGNGVCEFGEAVGTWAYTQSWHCPQDCPFELHACPQQVRHCYRS